eukprot:2024998-Rhodomonas_salina.2
MILPTLVPQTRWLSSCHSRSCQRFRSVSASLALADSRVSLYPPPQSRGPVSVSVWIVSVSVCIFATMRPARPPAGPCLIASRHRLTRSALTMLSVLCALSRSTLAVPALAAFTAQHPLCALASSVFL